MGYGGVSPVGYGPLHHHQPGLLHERPRQMGGRESFSRSRSPHAVKKKGRKKKGKQGRMKAKPPPEPEATLEAQPLLLAGISGPLSKAQAFTGWTNILLDEYRRSFVSYRKKAFTPSTLKDWFDQLSKNIKWNRPRVFTGPKDEDDDGRLLPRHACWLTARGCSCQYEYSGTHWPPMTMPAWFLDLTEKVSRACGLEERPNSCNVNYYESGSDSCGWHADDEHLFDANRRDSLVISLSLGATRNFEVHPMDEPQKVTKLQLENGDLLTMEGLMQKHYRHRVPREQELPGPRINLTWRWVTQHQRTCPCHAR